MNLIQISERLKEAPDNLLMREVQAPTGQYPAYLIISEMTRRKKLREGGAQQQAPQTTVAEDMASEGGLAATPQAMASTAGMDVNGEGDYEEQPVEMASGGIVAFQRGRLVDNDGIFPGMSFPAASQMGRELLPYGEETRAAAQRIFGYQPMSSEAEEAAIAAGREKYSREVPFRREQEQARIAERERALEGERASNVNMSLMEAGLGMMASRAPRGIQGIAEGGLKGLSALRSGKQEIKKSEAYLDQARDNFARAQELYDQQKYAAGDRALARAEQREARGLALANAQIVASSALRTQARQDLTLPGEMRKQELGLSVLEQTAPFAGRKAQAEINKLNSETAFNLAMRGKGGLKSATPLEYTQAKTAAAEIFNQQQTALPAAQRLNSGTPAYYAAINEIARQMLADVGKVVNPSMLQINAPPAPGQKPGQRPGQVTQYSEDLLNQYAPRRQ
jgi:hypothetical protein